MQTKYGTLFLWTLIGFAVVFIGYLFWSHCSLKHSQEQIRKDYIAHIQKLIVYISIGQNIIMRLYKTPKR